MIGSGGGVPVVGTHAIALYLHFSPRSIPAPRFCQYCSPLTIRSISSTRFKASPMALASTRPSFYTSTWCPSWSKQPAACWAHGAPQPPSQQQGSFNCAPLIGVLTARSCAIISSLYTTPLTALARSPPWAGQVSLAPSP